MQECLYKNRWADKTDPLRILELIMCGSSIAESN